MDYNKPSKQKANELFLRRHGKVWGTPYLEEQLEIQKKFLIICEGENTEPGYFCKFPVPTKTVLIEGGRNTKNALVDYALELQKSGDYGGREIWCVFDFDVKPDEAATQPQDFNSAILKAQQHGLKVAWSNDAFELWFVLHYQKLDAPLSRHQLYPILKEKWGLESFHDTAKTRAFCEDHYDRHGDADTNSQKLAIRRARELHTQFGGRQDFAAHCPCTTVYLLVEELNKYIKK
jgi:hypothetical protein